MSLRSLRIEPSAELFAGQPITRNMIGGSHANQVTAGVRGATIAGGGVPTGNSDPNFSVEAPNRVTDHYGTVGGGYGNRAGDDAGTLTDRAFATVGGGYLNTASGISSNVDGGQSNIASGDSSTVGGGDQNFASGIRSTVGGGFANFASGDTAVVVGGSLNTASSNNSTVGGGFANCAGGFYSWAGGRQAKVRVGSSSGAAGNGCTNVASAGDGDGDNGTFVWADSQGADFVSTGPNQFLVRAAGGIYLGTNSSVSIPAGRFLNTSTGAHLTSGGTWTNASSRALKTDFAAVDPLDVLGRVLELGISTWRYRESSEGRHLGPVAEDFHALFGLGDDERSISTVDASGVALAAIQGLNQKLEAERDALAQRVEVLDTDNAELRAELDRRDARHQAESAELRARLDKLEAMLTHDVRRER